MLPEPSLQQRQSLNLLNLIERNPQNKNTLSPFFLNDHKLGIAYWCIPVLYSYCETHFRMMKHQVVLNSKELMQLTRAMLMINADCYTAWNVRYIQIYYC